jgi:hypothetical protein
MLCNVNTSRVNSNPLIMTSPALIDKNSAIRVSRRLFGFDDMLDRHVITSSEVVAHNGCRTAGAAETLPSAMFTCAFSLDRAHLEKLGGTLLPKNMDTNSDDSLTGKGKASTRERALHLCGMHLELLLYRAGVPLFPHDPISQFLYDRCAENNGWLRSLRHPHAPVPLPLKELHPTYNEYQYRMQRCAALSNEEKFLRYHGEAFNYAKTTIPIDSLHSKFSIPGFLSVEMAESALEAFQRSLSMRALGFVVACAGDFRTTLIMYNFDRAVQLIADSKNTTGGASAAPFMVDEAAILTEEAVVASTAPLASPSSLLPVPAFGVGPTIASSRALCILHALEEINVMNLPVFLFQREKQAEYAAARRALGLYAPTDEVLGHIPSQSRILHQSNPQSDVQWYSKRERGGRDGGAFTVTMAYAPTPSFSHDERRSPHVVHHEELGLMLQLHTLRQFAAADEITVNAMNQLYSSALRTLLYRHRNSSHTNATERAAAAVSTGGLPFQSVVEDQGSGWRHRSTAWLKIPVGKNHDKGMHIFAVGRGTRLVEAERACVAHAAVLLTHLGMDSLLGISAPSAVEEHDRLMRLFNRVVLTKQNVNISTLFPADVAGPNNGDSIARAASLKLFVECPPIVLQSTYDAMKAHTRLYHEMRSNAIQRWRRGT